MRKIVQASVLSLLITFSFSGVAFGATTPTITGASPCGSSDKNPYMVNSPFIRLSIDEVTGASTYDWYIDGGGLGTFHSTESFKDLTSGDLSLFLTGDPFYWQAGVAGDVSQKCWVKIAVTGATPCGTAKHPIDVMSPVDVSVYPILEAGKYHWSSTGIADQPTDKNHAELNLPIGKGQSWSIIAKDSADALLSKSDKCFINVTNICPTGSVCIKNPLSSNSFSDLFDTIVNFVFTLSIPIAVLMVMYAGFILLSGGADPKKFSQARDMLVWTAVGFLIILLSKGLPFVIKDILR